VVPSSGRSRAEYPHLLVLEHARVVLNDPVGDDDVADGECGVQATGDPGENDCAATESVGEQGGDERGVDLAHPGAGPHDVMAVDRAGVEVGVRRVLTARLVEHVAKRSEFLRNGADQSDCHASRGPRHAGGSRSHANKVSGDDFRHVARSKSEAPIRLFPLGVKPMPTPPIAYPDVATREDWLAARKKLLAREREVTHLRDAVNAERRRLPMVKIEKDYVFEGPDGELRLRDMFEGRTQLYIHHFMWIDAIDRGCPSCTAAADLTFTEKDRALLHAKGVTFACVSRAPYSSIARYRDEHGWTFPWYSSRDNDFSYDYHVTLDPARAPIEYNYKSLDEMHAAGFGDDDLRGDWPGASVFLRRGEDVFHTYSAYARGLDHSAVGYPFLDLTPYGRQEPWEDSPAGWPQGGIAAGMPLASGQPIPGV
jgi:predicted dithiol-disulfide oxidoreductase (DUF899 family)